MAYKWLICITVLIFLENNEAKKPPLRQEATKVTVKLPPPRLLANTRPRPNKNLEERPLGQEYIEQYQEMMRASQESFESFDERDDKRLKRLIGDDDLGLMAEAGGVRRRRVRSGGPQAERSEAERRRARSRAARRDKLHAQGLSSHRRHSQPRPRYLHGDD